MTQPTPTTAPPALLNITLGVMLALMLGWFFHIASGVLVPMVLGLMISYVVMAVARLTGTIQWIGVRLSPGLRLAVAAVLICYGLVQLVTLLAANLAAFASSAPEYQTRLLAAVQTLANMAGFQGDLTWETLRSDLFGQINLQSALRNGVASSVALLGGLIFVLLNVVFMLLERGSFDAKLDKMVPDGEGSIRLRKVIEDINGRVGRYLVVKTLINIALGVLCYGIMLAYGLEFAVLWAIVIALVNYIPYIGSFIGVAVPGVIALGQFGLTDEVITLILFLSAAQFLVGNVLEPQVMGTSMDLSPYAVLISLTVWTALWGIAGAIAAIPITAVMVIVLSEFSATRPIAILLSRSGGQSERRG